MQSSQRKRFSYLTVQQRALNSSNVIVDTDKAAQSRHGSVVGSNTKVRGNNKEEPGVQQMYMSYGRNSSVKKQQQPLSQLSQNPIFSSIRTSATKNPILSNKQNLPSIHSHTKLDQKPSRPVTNVLNIQTRIKQLQQQNSLILKQTQQKFLSMQKHLQRVQGILKEKQQMIGKLMSENGQLKERCSILEKGNGLMSEQKQELMRIINEKNGEIRRLMMEGQEKARRQEQLLAQLNTYTLQSQLSALQPSTNPQPLLPCYQSSQTQTDLLSTDIDQLITKSHQPQVPTDKLNYRQKYQSLFKRALQMQDQMYKLKQQLFDSQNQVKAIQQEFNTYKIFNQIEKISMGEK